MKKIISLILCLSALMSLCGCRKATIQVDTRPRTVPQSSVLPFTVGVNINGLEGSINSGFTFKQLSNEFTYENIKSRGFDHIRLPLNFLLLYSKEDNALIEKKMKKIDKILDLIEAAKLYVMIDFHGWWDMDFFNEEHRETFLNVWERVAERYKDRSDYVIFELLNEPNIPDVTILNNWQRGAIERIRKTNPHRLIICATPDGNQPWLLENYYLPMEDDNLAAAVHLYNPADFTHQGCFWAGRTPLKRVRLTEGHLSTLKWDLEQVKKFIDKTGIPVVINEFGMNIDLAKSEDKNLYFETITNFCVENDIPWTIWDYSKGEFSIYNKGKWDEETLDALFLR